MKSIGEVMSIGRMFEEMIQKAIHAINDQDFIKDVDEELVNPTDKWIFTISTAFYHGSSFIG